MICKPLHLLDCCVETDNATCIIVTRTEHARDLRPRPALIRGVVGRCCRPRADHYYQHGPLATVAGHYAKDILWPNAGLGPSEVDLTGSYDAFTFTTMLQLEDYGFCSKGEGGEYVSDGTIELGGARPNNTSGGHLCEGYTHGMNMVIENVRQLRARPTTRARSARTAPGSHTYDYGEGGCRQVRDAEISANLGWGTPGLGSAMIPSGAEGAGRAVPDGGRRGGSAGEHGTSRRAHAHADTDTKERAMPLRGEYLGMILTVDDVDEENASSSATATRATSASSADGRAPPPLPPDHRVPVDERARVGVGVGGREGNRPHLHRSAPPDPARVRELVPYMILLVDLDTQKGSRPSTRRSGSRGTWSPGTEHSPRRR